MNIIIPYSTGEINTLFDKEIPFLVFVLIIMFGSCYAGSFELHHDFEMVVIY